MILKKTESEYKEYQREYGELIESNSKLQSERININDNLQKLYHELQEMDVGIRDNLRQRQQKEVLQTLQKLFNGIYGKLNDLIEVRQTRFNLAVAVGLGINHDAVVVEDKETAKQCMQHMRKIRRGHFRFIPLNDIKTYPVSQELRRFPGTSKPMMDVIKYEPQFERAVQFALNNTVVVDEINEAREIAYNLAQNLSGNSNDNNNSQSSTKRIRVVCLDGSIIQPNGNISGGYSRDLREKARGFNEKEKNKKVKLRDNLIQKLRDIDDKLGGNEDEDEDKKSVHELKNLLTELENARKNKKLRLDTLRKQLSEKEKQLKGLKKDIKSKRSKIKKFEKEVNEAKEELDECDEEIIQKENEIFEEVADELGVDTIREYEEQKLQKIEEKSAKRKEFNVKLTEIENKQKFTENKNKNNKDEIKKIQKRLKKLRKDLRDIQDDKLKKLRKQITKEENTVNNEEKKSDEIQIEVKERRKSVGDANKEIVKKRKEKSEKMQEKSKLNGWMTKLEQTQKNILQQAKHQQVELKSKKQLRSKRRKKKPAKKPKKRRGGHRRKRRKKNDGDSSDEQESDEEEEEEESEDEDEHKTDDEDLTDNEEEEEEEEEDFDEDMDIKDIMVRRMENIDLAEFENKEDHDRDAMDEDEDEEHEEDEQMEYESRKKQYKNEIDKLNAEITEMQPNMKALEQYKKLQIRHKDGSTESKRLKKDVQLAWNKVEELKHNRSRTLQECFDVISKNIKIIYAELTKSRQYKTGGRAFLDLSGSEPDPFTNSAIFNVMPPGKPFREMQQLSGGEKSVASLALLFAIHSYKPSPFFILDEIDAALDQKNVQKVCNYIIKKSKQNTQIIVISLKDKFFSNADSLIGVCKHRGNGGNGGDSSKILSIDLTKYDNNRRQQQQRQRRSASDQDDEKQQ